MTLAEKLAALDAQDARDENGLLPCPFCGGKAMFVIGARPSMPAVHYVMCTYRECNMATAMRSFAADAARDWNRRAPRTPPEVVRALVRVATASAAHREIDDAHTDGGPDNCAACRADAECDAALAALDEVMR